MTNLATSNPVMSDQGVASVPVTIGGVTLPAGNTAAQRFEAHAKAGTVSQFHTDANVTRFGQGEAMQTATKAPPPSTVSPTPPPPAALEQSNRLADFDREMQQKGLQMTPLEARGAPAAPVVRDEQGRFTGNPAGVEALNKAYAALPPAEREAARGQYEVELREFFAGRQLGESRADFQARQAGAPPQQPPSAAASQFTPEQWTEGHKSVTDKEGWIPAERINPESLSGYRMPAVMEGGTVSSGIFHMLSVARAAGFTQAQVEAWANAEAKA